MSKITSASLTVIVLFIAACSGNSSHRLNGTIRQHIFDYPKSNQVKTGFYFLASGSKAIRMRSDFSDKIYSIDSVPFVSVANIEYTKLTTTRLPDGDYTELCLTFDSKGTKDLEDGTGNVLHPKIATVIAGKLLYVTDNIYKIRSGKMCIGLTGYSEDDMKEIKRAVDQKL